MGMICRPSGFGGCRGRAMVVDNVESLGWFETATRLRSHAMIRGMATAKETA